MGVNLFGAGYDYRTTVGVWFRGVFAGRPHAELMATAPAIYQIHAISAWFLFALWPFTRLVHAWSYPVWYLARPFIVYRRAAAPARVSHVGATAPEGSAPRPGGPVDIGRT
jgi:nitrate reductase gamma subunit